MSKTERRDDEDRIRRNNLKAAWKLFHPLNHYQLVPLCEREWGDDWWKEVHQDLQ